MIFTVTSRYPYVNIATVHDIYFSRISGRGWTSRWPRDCLVELVWFVQIERIAVKLDGVLRRSRCPELWPSRSEWNVLSDASIILSGFEPAPLFPAIWWLWLRANWIQIRICMMIAFLQRRVDRHRLVHRGSLMNWQPWTSISLTLNAEVTSAVTVVLRLYKAERHPRHLHALTPLRNRIDQDGFQQITQTW